MGIHAGETVISQPTMPASHSLRRRTLLGSILLGGIAGCIGDDSDDNPEQKAAGTILGPPEESRGSPSHPTYGDPIPDFELPDPHADELVTADSLSDEGPFVLTFIYTSCTGSCGELMGLLELVQNDASEEGWLDDVNLVAMTFDPEVDGADTLRAYGEIHGLDASEPHFRFLRPETSTEAIELVDQHFGVPADRHDDDAPDDADPADLEHVHYYMIFLVNGEGIVERSYPSPILFDRSANDFVEDVRSVVT